MGRIQSAMNDLELIRKTIRVLSLRVVRMTETIVVLQGVEREEKILSENRKAAQSKVQKFEKRSQRKNQKQKQKTKAK